MPKAPFADLLHYLRHLYPADAGGNSADGELLNRFISAHDEDAFTALVHRHGSMVLSVCQRLLGDRHLAEDSFQATFIVLARRAATIRSRTSLGTWLYAVAQRVALKAKGKTAAWRNRERQSGTMTSGHQLNEHTWQELRSILDEEIARLPEKYQAPLVLCYLEAKSHDRAAKELGCAKTTLERRLSRGRELLRLRLIRRGVTLSAAALATTLGDKAMAVPVGVSLTINTVKAAIDVIAGKALADGFLAARAVVLAEEAMVGMAGVKGKLVLLVLVVGLAIGGAGWACYGALGETSQPAEATHAQPPDTKQAGSPTKTPVLKDQYGDPLPEGAVARLGAQRFRHEGGPGWVVRALAFTPDGKTLIGPTEAGVLVWDATTGKERYRLPVRLPGAYNGLAISPDGTTFPISEGDARGDLDERRRVCLYELDSGKQTRTFWLPKNDGAFIRHLSFSPDGKTIACNNRNGGKTVVFDVMSGQVRASLGGQDSPYVCNLAFSPDSKTLAAAIDLSLGLKIWDISTGKVIRTIHELPALNDKTYVRAVAFSPDSKMLAFADAQHIFLSDPATGKDLGQLQIDEITAYWNNYLAFTPDSKKLISRSGSRVLVWDMAARNVLHTLDGRGPGGEAMALSPDGKTVALDTGGCTVQLWDVPTGKELFTKYPRHDYPIRSLAYAPDGKMLAAAEEDGQIILWDTATKHQCGVLPSSARTLSFSPSGTQLATAGFPDSDVRIWDVAAKRKALVIAAPDMKYAVAAIFSSNGRKLATLNGNYTDSEYCLRQWDVATGKQDQIWTILQQSAWPSLAPDGKTVCAELQTRFGKTEVVGGIMSVYDVQSGRKHLLRGDDKEIMLSPTFSPDSKLLATGMWGPNSAVRVWEIATGKEIFLLKGHLGAVEARAWSPDGRLLATGDERRHPYETIQGTWNLWNRMDWDVVQTVRLWDMATGKQVARFGGFKADVTALTFAPDGKSVAAGLRDGTILVLDGRQTSSKLFSAPRLGKKELESHWIDLAGDNATLAHQALWRLASEPRQTVPFLKDRLKPVARVDQDKIQRLVADMDSGKFAVRQAASNELAKVGEQVQVPIQKAMKGNISLETRRRLEQILKNLDGPHSTTLRTIRAIMALERIASSEARAVLEGLARGALGARETEEAKASLERLTSRPPTK